MRRRPRLYSAGFPPMGSWRSDVAHRLPERSKINFGETLRATVKYGARTHNLPWRYLP